MLDVKHHRNLFVILSCVHAARRENTTHLRVMKKRGEATLMSDVFRDECVPSHVDYNPRVSVDNTIALGK